MTEEREFITKEQAIAMLPDADSIHVFMNPGINCLIGADWSRDEILRLLEKAKKIEIGGPECKRMNHHLVAWDGNEPRFIEVRADSWKAEEGGKR